MTNTNKLNNLYSKLSEERKLSLITFLEKLIELKETDKDREIDYYLDHRTLNYQVNHENIKYLHSFYRFLISNPNTAVKDSVETIFKSIAQKAPTEN